jgi:hypothetical protein
VQLQPHDDATIIAASSRDALAKSVRFTARADLSRGESNGATRRDSLSLSLSLSLFISRVRGDSRTESARCEGTLLSPARPIFTDRAPIGIYGSFRAIERRLIGLMQATRSKERERVREKSLSLSLDFSRSPTLGALELVTLSRDALLINRPSRTGDSVESLFGTIASRDQSAIN